MNFRARAQHLERLAQRASGAVTDDHRAAQIERLRHRAAAGDPDARERRAKVETLLARARERAERARS